MYKSCMVLKDLYHKVFCIIKIYCNKKKNNQAQLFKKINIIKIHKNNQGN